MRVTSSLIIILSLCRVNLSDIRIKKYVPGDDVMLDCNVNIARTAYHTISWLFENKVVSNGDKLNTMSNKSLRYELTADMDLRIKNTSIGDEGKYTCLSNPPLQDGKYTIRLKIQNNKPTVHTTSKETTNQALHADVETTNFKEEQNNVNIKEKENNRKKVNLVGKCKEVNQRKRYTILLNV
ncbi:unnamed protein product [Mytilus edulis]|uniref:Ig-like domain-containing protein n=1 Tax=Mytilus edulis TaxID=6550 RepID=A0A8S3TJE8_MYTED|nr:unnamed protein product [Mytilus edulis]